MTLKIRRARPDDSEQILAIYRPVVESTSISFEIEPPTGEQIAGRIEAALVGHEWLVGEIEESIVGYAYATPYRARKAYEHSTETAVYVHQDFHGHGYGRSLYQALFESLARLAYRRAYAGIALPNAASIALHESLGFEYIGVFNEAGYKFGKWHDVSWWQKSLTTYA